MNIFKSKISESEQSLVTLQASFDDLNEQFATLQESLKEASEQASTFKSEFERVDAENKELKLQLEDTKKEVVEVVTQTVEVDELAALKAIDIIASAGHEQVEVLEDETLEDTFDTKSVIEQFKSLKGKELQEFYNTHKKEIKDNLGLK